MEFLLVNNETEIDTLSASGFEKSLINSVLLLFINLSMGSSILALDEVDAQASDENSTKLLRILLGMIRDTDSFSHVFIVSHRKDAVEDVALAYPDVLIKEVGREAN